MSLPKRPAVRSPLRRLRFPASDVQNQPSFDSWTAAAASSLPFASTQRRILESATRGPEFSDVLVIVDHQSPCGSPLMRRRFADPPRTLNEVPVLSRPVLQVYQSVY